MTEDRGITNISKAIQYCDARLVLCGSFDSDVYKESVLEMNDKIDYLGQLSYEELLNEYEKCSVGLCTLEKTGQYATLDTFATKIYEYMMFGLPVIITDTPYNCKKMEEYAFGKCVDPTDIKAVASAIQYFVEHPVEAYKCGENGYKAYIERFNWSKEEKKLLQLYKEIIDLV